MKTWIRRAVSAASVTALAALPLVVPGTSLIASADTSTAACTTSTDDSTPTPVTGGNKESRAANAAARYFPASQVAIATAIAGGESSWNPNAVNKAAGGNYGLWQINSVHSALLGARNWRNPSDNAWMAYQVWDAADGRVGDRHGSWKPWSAYNSGSYKQFLKDKPNTTVVDDQPTPMGCPVAGGPGIIVATWNVLKSNSSSNIAAGTRELTQHADVFGLQELGNERKRAAAAEGAAGFTMTTDHTAVPILFRSSKYMLLDQGRELAIGAGQKVEYSPKDHSSTVGPKWVTWVHLQDKAGGQSFYVLNTHMMVGAENSSRLRHSNPRRVALYHQQLSTLTGLADQFRATGSAVYATCDCNVNYAPTVAPVVTLQTHDLVPSWATLDSRATHGRRAIDYVFSNAAPDGQVTGSRHGSDHAWLAVSYNPVASNGIITGAAEVRSVRTVTDPASGRLFTIQIPTGKAGIAIEYALKQLGEKYVHGGDGPRAWDSSGLTGRAWQAAGVDVKMQSDLQRKSLKHVYLSDIRPGDILWTPGHVALYLGDAGGQPMVIETVHSDVGVRINAVSQDPKALLRP